MPPWRRTSSRSVPRRLPSPARTSTSCRTSTVSWPKRPPTRTPPSRSSACVGALMAITTESTSGTPTPPARGMGVPGGTPAPARGLELLGPLRGSGYRDTPFLVRRVDGQTLQLTPLLYRLLETVDGRRDYAELAAAVSERIGKHAEPDDVRFLVEEKLRPLGVLRQPDGSEPAVKKSNPLLALRGRIVISDPAMTRRLTTPFAKLFAPPVVLAMMVAFFLSTWWLLFEKGLAPGLRHAMFEPELLLLVFALTILSAGFHEFGHAAAATYGGARPGAMGAGLYLVWPVFYTDVTDAYRLD